MVWLKGMARALVLASFGVVVSGCSHLHLTQQPDQVITRTGTYDDYANRTPAGPAAARVLPYAILAEQTYEPRVYSDRRAFAVDRTCIEDDPAGCGGLGADKQRAKRLLDDWRYVWSCQGPVDCRIKTVGTKTNGAASLPSGLSPVDGLGVQIWVRRGAVCREAVVAFRGTVKDDTGDWISNLHWVTRFLPYYDQYDQVRDYIGGIVTHITSDPCYRARTTTIIAIGHSLGGGLAQLAAYADGDIRQVYTFDPSFVTGYYSTGLRNRDANVIGLRSERIYEHGEILAYGRYIVRQFNPPTACDPRIVNLRFDVLHGSVISQHGLTPFTTALLRAARHYRPEPDPVIMQPCSEGGPPTAAAF